MLLEARSTFAANDAFVDGVIAVAINICHATIFEMNFNAATAGAHVTCGGFDFIPGLDLGIDCWLEHGKILASLLAL